MILVSCTLKSSLPCLPFATAVTVVKAVPTPVQYFQRQSSFSLILGCSHDTRFVWNCSFFKLSLLSALSTGPPRLRRILIIAIHLLNPIVAIQLRLTRIRPMNPLAQAAIPLLIVSICNPKSYNQYQSHLSQSVTSYWNWNQTGKSWCLDSGYYVYRLAKF